MNIPQKSLGSVYYFYPLSFSFTSATTIQVIRDYAALASQGWRTCLFGYRDPHGFACVQDEIGTSAIDLLLTRKAGRFSRNLLKTRFALKMIGDRSGSIVVSRNYNKTMEAMRWNALSGWRYRVVMECHEDAFPWLLDRTAPEERPVIERRFRQLFARLHGVIFTNYSQLDIANREFSRLPAYAVLPNGVDVEKFSQAVTGNDPERLVVTYVGQFTSWKNVGLLFAAMARLDSRFVLRIVGGKGDLESETYIRNLERQYGIVGRIDYRGFIQPEQLVEQALNGSSALLLPLGDTLEARCFTSPMKLFEYLATGIPVVAVAHPSVTGITGNDTIHLAPNDPDAFAKAIVEAAASTGDMVAKQRRQALSQRFAYTQRGRRQHDFFANLVATKAN